ncbi:hypothetical protein FRC09_013531 [Ceratobasidium sp. 395]|nr:hypothetical protein FRC09_013531 [Ceratobasidium sp. 395]
MVEQAFIQLGAQLESLAAEEYTLSTARLSLSVLRNRSETLVPINILPPETLTQIFMLSVSNCREHHRSFPYAFANTCVYWRQLALDTPYFWTHVDIGPDIPGQLSQLMLERAKTNPLHFHMYDNKTFRHGSPTWDNVGWEDPNWEDLDSVGLYYEDPLVQLFGNFAHRVHTLELSSNDLGGDFFAYVTKVWLDRGDKDLAKSLSISLRENVLLDDSQEDVTRINTSERGRAVLLSLKTLRLYRTRFNWDSNAYYGLVDLQLGFKTMDRVASISSLELVRILTASPKLAVLRLNGLEVTRTENIPQAIPVPLNHLQVLNLIDMSAVSLGRLLPLVALPRPSSAELRVGLEVSTGLEKELKDFFSRSSITTLYCLSQSRGYDAWSSILAPLDSLRTLILDMNHLDLQDEAPLLQHSTTSQVAAGSRPLSLTLRHCRPLSSDLSDLITNLGVHELRVEEPPSTEEYWQQMEETLLSVHPNLRYIAKKNFTIDNPHWDISSDHWRWHTPR